MKIVINKCYGGFGLSDEAVREYARRAGIELETRKSRYGPWTDFTLNGDYWSYRDIERTDPILVSVVEEMGEAANGSCADLSVIEIPDDVEWKIDEYDGIEWVAEVHRTWG